MNQCINSCCDLGSSMRAAVTATTQIVRERRLIDVAGSNDNTTVTMSQAPNRTNAGDNNVASPRASFRMANATVSTLRPPNTA